MSFHERSWPWEAQQNAASQSCFRCCKRDSRTHTNPVMGVFSAILCWYVDILAATMENMAKKTTQKGWVSPAEPGSQPRSLDGRATGSPTAKNQKTRGARLVWLAPNAGKMQDWTVSCTHVSQVLLLKI